MKKTPLICLCAAILLIAPGCKKSFDPAAIAVPNSTSKDGITPPPLDWEHVDWMPTPPGQSQIPPPWIGQGSIASTYGTDVINDHKSSDGWILVYNTFDPNAPGPLTNPYFMLYNKYRGLLRIYMYITTQFAQTSNYLVDGLTVVSNTNSTMLNFLGRDVVDVTQTQSSYEQAEPAPRDGSRPLASNKWFMLQYEIAYDPGIASTSYQNIQLSWFSNYNSIDSISLGGTAVGTLNGTIGAPTSAMNTALHNGGTVAGTAALSLLGTAVVNNNGDASGTNTMGIPTGIYASLYKGINGALSAAEGNIPGAITGIFSAIFGGSTGQQTVSLNLNATITLKGTQTSSGSFPSSPTSVWVPGSIITPAAQNYIPLYNNTMGVFNVTAKPVIYVHSTRGTFSVPTGNHDQTHYFIRSTFSLDPNFISSSLIINPTVASYVTVASTQLVAFPSWPVNPRIGTDGTPETVGNLSDYFNLSFFSQKDVLGPIQPPYAFLGTAAVRLVLKVAPPGGTVSYITKTFAANIVQN